MPQTFHTTFPFSSEARISRNETAVADVRERVATAAKEVAMQHSSSSVNSGRGARKVFKLTNECVAG